MKSFLLLLLLCHDAPAVKHCLRYFLVGLSGLPDIPEFVAFMTVDDILVGYCDSSGNRPQPKQAWTKQLIKDDPQHLLWYCHECLRHQYIYKDSINNLKQQLNQSGGVHIFQRTHGCDWDDETEELDAFNQFGFDGEDFISLDSNTMTWVAARPEALITKYKWERDFTYKRVKKIFNTVQCPEMLKRYLEYSRSFLQRAEPPSVFLLQKTPWSPVSCHATGFHTSRAAMFWRKDGQELLEDVDRGEILPNPDGTFQMTIDLNVSAVAPEDWRRYDCVLHLSGVEGDIVTRLEKRVIRTNWVSFFGPAVSWLVIQVVAGGLCFFAGLLIWKTSRKVCRTTNSEKSAPHENAALNHQR